MYSQINGNPSQKFLEFFYPDERDKKSLHLNVQKLINRVLDIEGREKEHYDTLYRNIDYCQKLIDRLKDKEIHNLRQEFNRLAYRLFDRIEDIHRRMDKLERRIAIVECYPPTQGGPQFLEAFNEEFLDIAKLPQTS